METHQELEKVYVAVGKNVDEGIGILRWALCRWSSKHVSFVIVHIDASSKYFVHTPLGKLPASSANHEKLELFRARDHERVDKLLSKYMLFCSKVKAEVLEIDASNEPVHVVLLGLISSLGIKKLVMGFKSTKSLSWKAKNSTIGSCYVQKHKPDFCELFIVCGGKLVMLKEESVDEGGYFVDECGAIVADFRKRARDKGSFKGWLGSFKGNAYDRRSPPPHRAVSPPNAAVAREAASDKWEDNEKEIDSYVQCLLASSSPELMEQGDEVLNQFEVPGTNMPQGSLNRAEMLRAIEEAVRLAELKRNEARADKESQRKAERITRLCNQRNEQLETNVRDEMTKESNLEEELGTLRGQLREVVDNIKESKRKLSSELDQQSELIAKLQANSLEKSRIESEMPKVESESAEMSRRVEETRRQNDFVRRRTEYYKAMAAMAATNGLSYRYREFTEEEITDATDNLSEKMAIAAGSQGAIYGGRINHTDVAIKFNVAFMDSLEEFESQAELLHEISHPHVVGMIGACAELRCIVFERMKGGSLHDALFPASPKGRPPRFIPWHARVRIAANVCSALGFLHSSQPRPTAHGRLDACHVLLDQHLTAKITGLRRSTLSTSPASDVAALGRLVVELLTGSEATGMGKVRAAVESGALAGILDQAAGDWPLDIAAELARAALRCSEHESTGDGEGVAALTVEMTKEIEALQEKAEGRAARGGDTPPHARPNVPDMFLCPILQEVMKEPFVAADGFSYELEAIREWLGTGHETSPMTNLRLKSKTLTANHNLQCLIREWHDKYS